MTNSVEVQRVNTLSQHAVFENSKSNSFLPQLLASHYNATNSPQFGSAVMSRRSIELGPSPFRKRWTVDDASRLETILSRYPAWSQRNRRGLKSDARSLLPPSVNEMPGPRPFLDTGLGELPPEIREMIWVLVLSPHEAPAIDVGLHQSLGLANAMSDVTLSEASPPSICDQVSCPALLRVCRMVYQEARDIYYAKTMFRFTDASSLTGFLAKIGIEQRSAITTLRLGGLTIKGPMVSQHFLDERYPANVVGNRLREDLAAMTITRKHPKAAEAAVYLRKCPHLKTIHLDMKVGEEHLYIVFLLDMCGFRRVVIDFPDTFHWNLRRAPEEFDEWWTQIPQSAKPRGEDWGDNIRGHDRYVEVNVFLK